MRDPQRLAALRALPTGIYLVMASACFVVLYGGITGGRGPWLWAAAGLVGLETLVFAFSGLRCPLTAIAVRYGAAEDSGRPGAVFDTFLPERLTRLTAWIFGPIIVVGFGLLAWRWLAGA